MPADLGQLKFRRHLALSALLLILFEIQARFGTTNGSFRSILGSAQVSGESNSIEQEENNNHDHDEDSETSGNAVSRALDHIGLYLPTLNLNYTIGDFGTRLAELNELDKEVEQFYNNKLAPNMSYELLQESAIKAALRTAPIPLHNTWGYQSGSELKQSAGHYGNDTICKLQLEYLASRLDHIIMSPHLKEELRIEQLQISALAKQIKDSEAQLINESNDLKLFELLDTFGRVPADFLRGNFKWLGSYSSCSRMKLRWQAPRTQRRIIKFRYCLAAIKSIGWNGGQSSNSSATDQDPTGSKLNQRNFFIRVAVCLPEACDSRAPEAEAGRRNIERLIKANLAKPFDSNRYYLADMFCFPDDSSPMRRLPFSGVLLSLMLLIWLAAVTLSTTIHLSAGSRILSRPEDAEREDVEQKTVGVKNNWIKVNVFLMDRSRRLIDGVDLIDCLSLYSSWLSFTKRLNSAEHKHKQRQVEQLNGESQRFAQGKDLDLFKFKPEVGRKRVRTSSLNALKVIALSWIIAGHCLFYLGSAFSNLANLSNYMRHFSMFALTNGAMYITELFFIISGCLSSYLTFRRSTVVENEGVKLDRRLSTARFWLKISIARYLRILPTYLLVYSFVRLVSLHVGGSGPLWDYAVSANSIRRACSEESWLPVFTLTTNFVDIYGHCIVGGWYLSSDMQFLVASIPILLLLARCRLDKGSSGPTGSAMQTTAEAKLEPTSGQDGSKEAPVDANQMQLMDAADYNWIKVSKWRLRVAYGTILMLTLLSALLSIGHLLVYSRVDLSYILKFLPHMISVLSDNRAIYTNPVFRFRAFALGLILGHLLYLYDLSALKLPQLISKHGSKISSALAVLGFIFMFMPILYPRSKILASHEMTAVLTVASATGIDLLLCAMIFLLCIGKSHKVARCVLESPYWSLPAALSLPAFLVHSELIVLLIAQLSPPPDIQPSLMLFFLTATLLFTYLLALAIYLAFELPFQRLVDSLLQRKLR